MKYYRNPNPPSRYANPAQSKYKVETDKYPDGLRTVYEGNDQEAAEAAFTEYANRSYHRKNSEGDVFMYADGKIVRNYSGEAILFGGQPRTAEYEIAFHLIDLRNLVGELPVWAWADKKGFIYRLGVAILEAAANRLQPFKGAAFRHKIRYDGRYYVQVFEKPTEAEKSACLLDALHAVLKEGYRPLDNRDKKIVDELYGGLFGSEHEPSPLNPRSQNPRTRNPSKADFDRVREVAVSLSQPYNSVPKRYAGYSPEMRRLSEDVNKAAYNLRYELDGYWARPNRIGTLITAVERFADYIDANKHKFSRVAWPIYSDTDALHADLDVLRPYAQSGIVHPNLG
jgi:hypothetical protein